MFGGGTAAHYDTAIDPTRMLIGWRALKVGAGGYLDGVSQANDGTMVVTTDTYGAYIWDPSATTPVGNAGGVGAWKQLCNYPSLHAQFTDTLNYYAAGCYELQIAPTNSSIMYMAYLVDNAHTGTVFCGVYKSTDKGQTWIKTTFTGRAAGFGEEMNGNDVNWRDFRPKGIVYPTDPNTCFMGTGNSGLWLTKDGGTTWNQVTGIPTALTVSGGWPGYHSLTFRPGTPTQMAVMVAGVGIYVTSNANAAAGSISWTKIADYNGASQPVGEIKGMAYATNGNLVVTDINGGFQQQIWLYNGTWSVKHSWVTDNIGPGAIEVDPFDGTHFLAIATNSPPAMLESSDSGATWHASSVCSSSATDIPWIPGGGAPGLHFDRVIQNRVWALPNVQAAFYADLTIPITGTSPAFHGRTVGIEQLVGNDIICTKTKQPILSCWDSVICIPDVINDKYMTSLAINLGAVCGCWGIDYACNDPNFVVVGGDGTYAGGPTIYKKSTDYGQNWSNFTDPYPGAHDGFNVAVSTSLNFLVSTKNTAPKYTSDGGSTYTSVSLPGVASFTGFMTGYNIQQRRLAADKVTTGTFYILFNGLYSSTNGGVGWSKVLSAAINTGIMKCAPVAGHVWIAQKGDEDGTDVSTGSLWFSNNGGSNLATVSGVSHIACVGFGAPKPSQGTYAYSVYISGFVGAAWGVWRSDDYGATWNPLLDAASGVPYPQGHLDPPRGIEGDPSVWGRCYTAHGGSGYRQFVLQ